MPIIARLIKHRKKLLNIEKHHETLVKHHETHVKHHEPHIKHREPLVKHHETLEHSPFHATQSVRCSSPVLGTETSALGAATSSDTDIGDCCVGTTPQMCNRVTNHEILVFFSNLTAMSLHHLHVTCQIVTGHCTVLYVIACHSQSLHSMHCMSCHGIACRVALHCMSSLSWHCHCITTIACQIVNVMLFRFPFIFKNLN